MTGNDMDFMPPLTRGGKVCIQLVQEFGAADHPPSGMVAIKPDHLRRGNSG